MTMIKKEKTIQIMLRLTKRQNEYLEKVAAFSLKSKSALMREALELLFKTPPVQEGIKYED